MAYREGGRPQSLARLEVFSFRSARHPKNCDCGVPGLLGMSGSLLARVREPSALSAREADGNGGPLSLSLGGGRKEALVSFLLERTAVRRRRFKESRRPRGRVPPPGFFCLFFYSQPFHFCQFFDWTRPARLACLLRGRSRTRDRFETKKKKRNNFRRWITRLVRR